MLPASIIFGCRGASFIHGLLHISAPWAPPGCLPSTLLRVAPLFRAEASGGSFPASLEIEFFSSRLFSTSIHDDISENIDEVARVSTGRASLRCGSSPARSSRKSSGGRSASGSKEPRPRARQPRHRYHLGPTSAKAV